MGAYAFASLHGYVQNLTGFRPQTFVEVFFGAYAIRPYTGTCKIWRVLDANPCRRTFRGVCNTPLPEYVKNAPDFTLPNRDTYKTYPVLGANLCRETFRGVCNTPLHGYVQYLLGFTFPHTDAPKTHLVSSIPIRIRQKRARF